MSKRKPSSLKTARQLNEIKFFHSHIVNGKPESRCAEEMGLSRRTMRNYKKSTDYRQMAIEYLENSKLKGLKGTISRLVKALDAEKIGKRCEPGGSISWGSIPDERTRETARKEIEEIYGLRAPEQKDTTIRISISSDEDLFGQIDEAQRACRFVESHPAGAESPELASGEQAGRRGDFESRQRAILQDVAISESQ